MINFHSNGNSFVWPFNGKKVNDIQTKAPGVLPILKDIVANAQFPPDLKTGNAFEVMEDRVSGDADDWIVTTFGIPSVTSEIGYPSQFIDDWVVKSKEQALDLLKQNTLWLDYIFTNLPRYSQDLAKARQ